MVAVPGRDSPATISPPSCFRPARAPHTGRATAWRDGILWLCLLVLGIVAVLIGLGFSSRPLRSCEIVGQPLEAARACRVWSKCGGSVPVYPLMVRPEPQPPPGNVPTSRSGDLPGLRLAAGRKLPTVSGCPVNTGQRDRAWTA